MPGVIARHREFRRKPGGIGKPRPCFKRFRQKELRDQTMSDHRYVLLASIDSTLPPKLIEAMRQLPIAPEIRVAFTVRQLGALLECYPPQVIVVDEFLLDGSGDAAKNLTAAAPLILLARPDRFGDAARILVHEDVECIAQTGDYLPLLVALIERHVRWARQPSVGSMLAWAEMPPEFAEVLRHEINNPLTGILGNAEMVLAHRERLPAAAAKRLEISRRSCRAAPRDNSAPQRHPGDSGARSGSLLVDKNPPAAVVE
jgi:signal transduction histidine kinase